MHKYVKTGLLMLTLVFPVLIFISLKVFTTNHYDLPHFVPVRDATTQQIRVIEGDTVFYQVADFSLSASDGGSIVKSQIQGKSTVVANLSNAPTDTVKQIILHISRVAGMLNDYPNLRLLTLLDSTQLDQELEIRQAQNFGKSWVIAAESKSTLESLLRDTFHLGVSPTSAQTILLNGRLSLLDSEGYIRGYYNALDPEEIERLMAEIRILEHNRTDN